MPAVAELLRRHAFAELFRQLGWDRAGGAAVVSSPDGEVSFCAVAQKRGLVVLHACAPRTLLSDRGALRDAQRRLLKSFHEHLAILSCDEPPKQVWLWACRRPDGRRLRHREHPFFSADPPPALLARLDGLGFTLDEEDGASLGEARDRVRAGLDVTAEQYLFTRYPKLGRESDALARRLAGGDESAFHPFVLMHRGLARKFARRYLAHWGIDPDDAEQIATIGLLVAARKFRPERGYQFGTYAKHWVRNACNRYAPDYLSGIHLPSYVFIPCAAVHLRLEALAATALPESARAEVLAETGRDGNIQAGWLRFLRALAVEELPDPNDLTDPGPPPWDALATADDAAALAGAMRHLTPRERDILRRRYGFDGPEHTLLELGEEYGITRERVRQIQQEAEKQLRRHLGGPAARYEREVDDAVPEVPPVAASVVAEAG